MKQIIVLACSALRREITHVMAGEGLRYPVFYLPEELHISPERLGAYLRDFIPRLHGVDYLLLPMGRCGNGTAGIPSGTATLVLPKSDDCTGLLLSCRSLGDMARPGYSYFFTESWLEGERSFCRGYKHMLEKYGPERGRRLAQALYKHYRYFTYLDTGCGDFETAAAQVRPLAEVVGAEVVSMKAGLGVLRKMLTLNLDDDFLLVPPGQTVAFERPT